MERYFFFARAVLILLSLLATTISINPANAGSSTIPPVTVHNTVLSISFSYPDNLYWEDDIIIPVSLFVTFENKSITMVSIWEIEMRLVDITANPTPYNPSLQQTYASGGNQTLDPISNPLYVIENPPESNFATLDFEIANVYWQSVLKHSVDAKIYLEVSLTLIGERRHPIIIYTSSGQQPLVTIQPQPAEDYTLSLTIAGIVLSIVAISLVIIHTFKRKKP